MRATYVLTMTLTGEVRVAVLQLPEGAVFTSADLGTSSILAKLCREGLIQRALRGVYYKPEYCAVIGEVAMPSVRLVAEAIARKNGWRISLWQDEYGQVPAHWVFICDKATKVYLCKGTPIYFVSHIRKFKPLKC